MTSQSRAKSERLREEEVQGLKYFGMLGPLLERLHEVGCQRDKAGNRQLFMDQYCALVLLFLFNPCVRSLRALQQASELANVQRKLRCGRASLGSLSEATDVFDPERLRSIIGELAAEAKPTRHVAGPHFEHVRRPTMRSRRTWSGTLRWTAVTRDPAAERRVSSAVACGIVRGNPSRR